jgi:uncharacterized membrane protein YbhN (UPF0104 family)
MGRPDMTGDKTRSWWSRYRKAILLSGLALALLLGVRASIGRLGDLESHEVPSLGTTVAAMCLLAAGQATVGYGWRRLVPVLSDPVASMWTFHATQPGKYLPLGVGQAVGQVALARDLGLPLRTAVAAWASHVAMIIAAGGVVGTLLVLHPSLGGVRWLALGGILAGTAVHRSVLQHIVGAGARFTDRLPSPDDLPSQRCLAEAFFASVGFMVLHGLAFALLLPGSDRGSAGWLGLIGAYGIATGSSIASPFPAGLGVREALLVLLAGAGAAATIAAAIVLRVATFTVEVALFVTFWALSVSRRRDPRPGRGETSPGGAGGPER